VAGFVATQGGKDSHAMIIARGVGLTGLAGVHDLFALANDGDALILDAEHNTWVLRPSEQEQADFKAQQQAWQAEQTALQTYASQASTSKDGYHLPLLANIEFVEEVDVANRYGIDGIGLFRTEFLFMQSDTLPSEDEQAAYYQSVAQRALGKPITFRLLDVGADKLAHVQALFGAYDGENPALGLRGVRMLLRKPDILKTQIRAILRCAAYAPISILVPMVIAVDEMKAVRQVLEEAKQDLGMQDDIALGCMIEVPAAALIAQDLAEVADFFSIGSNDLVQYSLAVDRADEHVGYLYDAAHPAILALMQMAADAAKAQHIPITVCGELAANTAWTQTFLNMRMSALSMTARHVLSVRKQLQELQAKT
jgi:phosphotransferase system enzyme I (PtsI)